MKDIIFDTIIMDDEIESSCIFKPEIAAYSQLINSAITDKNLKFILVGVNVISVIVELDDTASSLKNFMKMVEAANVDIITIDGLSKNKDGVEITSLMFEDHSEFFEINIKNDFRINHKVFVKDIPEIGLKQSCEHQQKVMLDNTKLCQKILSSKSSLSPNKNRAYKFIDDYMHACLEGMYEFDIDIVIKLLNFS